MKQFNAGNRAGGATLKPRSDPIWNQRIFYELLSHFAPGRSWLDLGCGRGTRASELLRMRRLASEQIYVGVDFDMESLQDSEEGNRVRAKAESLPFPDRCFDLVTSNMVFEHLDDPVAVLQEVNRVLNERGALIVHTASSLHYALLAGRVLSAILPRNAYVGLVSRFTGREHKDIFPTRYRANTTIKFSRAAARAGFIGGLLTHLETPLSFAGWRGAAEKRIRRLVPPAFKGTILAIYFKWAWNSRL